MYLGIPDEDKAILDRVHNFEGGYVNHPRDRGGPTNHGITLKTLSLYRGRKQTAKDVEALSASEAYEIIYDLYLKTPKYDTAFPEFRLRELMVDTAVNSGPARANRLLQESINDILEENQETDRLDEDSILGSRTFNATRKVIKQYGERRLVEKMVDNRLLFYAAIVHHDHSQAAFILGWVRRALGFRWFA